MLQREGLVRLHPQRGAVVFLPSVDDLREHYEIRAALEALAAAKTAERFEPAWAPPLEALLDEMRRRRRPRARYIALNQRFHTTLYEHSRPRPARGDDRRAARRVERLPAHLPRRRTTSRPRAWTPSTARSSPPASRATRERAAAATRDAPREHRRARRRPSAMKRCTERILTTHVGSLPRPDDLIRTMFAKQEGVPVDRGRARASAPARRSPTSSRRQARRRRRRRLRRRDEQAELRHLHQAIASTASAATSQPLDLRRTWSTSPRCSRRCSATRAARAAGPRPAPAPITVRDPRRPASTPST